MCSDARKLAALLSHKYRAQPQNELYEAATGNLKEQRICLDFKGCGFHELYRFDRKEHPSFLDFFNPDDGAAKDLTAFCDYVLICERGKRTYVLFIELARGEKTEQHARAQCQAAEYLFDYIEQSGKRVYGEEFCNKGTLRRSLLIRRNGRMSKRTIKNFHAAPNYDKSGFSQIKIKDGKTYPCRKLCA